MTVSPPAARRARIWGDIGAAVGFLFVCFLFLVAVPGLVFVIAVMIAEPDETFGNMIWERERMTALAHETTAGFGDVLLSDEQVRANAGEPPPAEAFEGGVVYIYLRPERQGEAQAICEAFRDAMLRRDPGVMPGFKVIVEGPEDPPAVITAENDYQDYSPTYATCGAAWWAWWLGGEGA